jgi:transposase InsO family protein
VCPEPARWPNKLLQPTRGNDRRCRPGFFRVTRPDELWHMDMTKVWTAAHGWVYLHVIVDGGYRDPDSQAFIESRFEQAKKRCARRAERESIDQARREITAYIDHYHHRPHSGIGYRTDNANRGPRHGGPAGSMSTGGSHRRTDPTCRSRLRCA